MAATVCLRCGTKPQLISNPVPAVPTVDLLPLPPLPALQWLPLVPRHHYRSLCCVTDAVTKSGDTIIASTASAVSQQA